MICSNSIRLCRNGSRLLLALLLLGAFVISPAFASGTASQSREFTRLPPEYGRVIYQKNSEAEDQVYIIGQAHRSGLSGGNGAKTVQSQLEIFRIGEWLVREKNVELLLPEGFFSKVPAGNAPEVPGVQRRRDAPSPDDETLRERLGETGVFVNADTLLKASYNLCLGQVEDERLYQEVAVCLRRLGEEGEQVDRAFYERLDLFQRRRTAVMLQNIPTVAESVFQQGAIGSRSAIFTIGLAHVPEIVTFLQQGEIEPFGAEQSGTAALALLERNFGVTVILPKSLAEDERLLRLTRLTDLAAK